VDESSCDNEKYFLCGQSVATSDFDNVELLACMDGTQGTPEVKAKTCATKGKLPFDKITACFKGDQGTDLVKTASQYFDGKFPKPVGVPHVEINGKQVAKGPPFTYADLIKDLCALGIQAGACKGKTVIV